MPNVIKYSTSSTPAGCLRKGDILIGNNTADYGATFFNGIDPPSGGYTIYINKTTGGPSIYRPTNNTELIFITNQIAGTNFVTSTQCLNYYSSQTDKIILNDNLSPVVTNGLTCYLDVTNVISYPNGGTNWYDLSGNNNNGGLGIGNPTFSTFDGKRSILFSNNNKYVYSPPYDGFVLSTNPGISASGTSFTFEAWFYQLSGGGQTVILSNAGGCNGYRWGPQGGSAYWLLGNSDCSQYAEGGVANSTTMIGRWVQMVGIFDRANTLGGGSRFYHYINGTLEGSVGTYTPTIQLGTPGITACCRAFDGYLSVVRVYNRALIQTEITQNFNAQKSYFGL
jgi:hypothetical protein